MKRPASNYWYTRHDCEIPSMLDTEAYFCTTETEKDYIRKVREVVTLNCITSSSGWHSATPRGNT